MALTQIQEEIMVSVAGNRSDKRISRFWWSLLPNAGKFQF